VGLGPGFIAGKNCHAVIETQRGHLLGRVIWEGEPLGDTGIPEKVQQFAAERVLRSPADGVLEAFMDIGDLVQPEQLVARVNGEPVQAPFKGVLRGLAHAGLHVNKGMKIGDVDPRNDPRYCSLVSDKSLAIGGAVLEAILSQALLRPVLWDKLY
jgi:xanthine dehydrogenase accessory factor